MIHIEPLHLAAHAASGDNDSCVSEERVKVTGSGERGGGADTVNPPMAFLLGSHGNV